MNLFALLVGLMYSVSALSQEYTICRYISVIPPFAHTVLTDGFSCVGTNCTPMTFTNNIITYATNVCQTATLSITAICFCNQRFLVEWSVLPNVEYTLERTTDFTNWVSVITLVGQTNRLSWVDDESAATGRFYRVKLGNTFAPFCKRYY